MSRNAIDRMKKQGSSQAKQNRTKRREESMKKYGRTSMSSSDKAYINGNYALEDGSVISIKVTAESGAVREYKLIVQSDYEKDINSHPRPGGNYRSLGIRLCSR